MHRPLTPPDDFDRTLLAKYLAGECSPEEATEVERWIAAAPRRGEVVEELRSVWARAGELAERRTPVDLDAVRRRVAARLRAEAEREHRRVARPDSVSPSGGRRLHRLHPMWAMAAALLLVVGAGLVWRAQYGMGRDGAAAARTTAPQEYATPRGQRGVVRLADGTRLILAPDSRLQVARQFGTAATRDVHLEGEAFFQVAHDPARPFLVHAANAVTRVLGTEFSVRAYPGDREVAVVVKSGTVALQDAVLTHGHLGRVDAGGRTTVTGGVDLDRALAWTEGRLVFKNTPLGEALPELSRWFDLEFRLSDSALASRQLTASFRTQPGEPMVDALALMLDVRAERRGSVVTFYPADSAAK